MVAVDAEDGHRQHAGDVVDVVGRQVAAAQQKVVLPAPGFEVRAVQPPVNFVADGEDADCAGGDSNRPNTVVRPELTVIGLLKHMLHPVSMSPDRSHSLERRAGAPVGLVPGAFMKQA